MIDEKTANVFIWCAVVGAVLGGLATLFAIFTGRFGINLWNLLDVAAFFGLAFGIFKKSRTCAIIMFIYHIANRVDMWMRTRDIMMSLGLIPLIFITTFFLGILGTFAYHSIKKEASKV